MNTTITRPKYVGKQSTSQTKTNDDVRYQSDHYNYQAKDHSQNYNRDRDTKQNNIRYQDNYTCKQIHQESTPDTRQRELAGETDLQHQEKEIDHNYRPERYGREEQGKDAHVRDTNRNNDNNSRHQEPEQELTSEFYHIWKIHNDKNNKRQHRQEATEPAKRPHVEQQPRIPQPYTTTNQNMAITNKNKSSIAISNKKSSNNQQQSTPDTRQRELAGENTQESIKASHKPNTTTLDLKITRRPLSPVHNLEPKKIVIKRSKVQATPNKPIPSADIERSNIKHNSMQTKSTVLEIEQPVHPNPPTESEKFEDINEEELPVLGYVSIKNTIQLSVSIVETQVIGTGRDELQYLLFEETTMTRHEPIEEGANIEMTSQDQETIEE